jgi:hypothetical protein
MKMVFTVTSLFVERFNFNSVASPQSYRRFGV